MRELTKLQNVRVYHGPLNIVGIGGYAAEFQRKNGLKSDFIVWYDDTPHQNHHKNLEINKVNPLIGILRIILNFIQCSVKYDIFHFYFGQSLLPFGIDLPVLKLILKKKIIMNYCGSDIRLDEVERKRNPYWNIITSSKENNKRNINRKELDIIKKIMMWWHDKWADKIIVTKDIYYSAAKVIRKEKILERININNAVPFPKSKPVLSSKVPLTIVHAPSNPAIKGTSFVENAITNLKKQKYNIKYIKLIGKPNKEVHRILKEEADIVIDQLLIGWFGTFTVESMHYGKPVCVYMIDEIKEKYFPKLPLINCDINNITDKLKDLIENPAKRRKFGWMAYKFVNKHFDYEKENKKLLLLYLSILRK